MAIINANGKSYIVPARTLPRIMQWFDGNKDHKSYGNYLIMSYATNGHEYTPKSYQQYRNDNH